MENKGPLLFSSLLSSRPHSLLSTAVCMARLFSLTGCESHETGGHQGPKPPRQHAPPQSAAHSIPQHSLCLHTNNFLHHFKYFIPQALCFSFPLAHSFFVKSCLSSSRIFFSLIRPPFFLPSSGPHILSHRLPHACRVFCLSHTSQNRKMGVGKKRESWALSEEFKKACVKRERQPQ